MRQTLCRPLEFCDHEEGGEFKEGAGYFFDDASGVLLVEMDRPTFANQNT